MNPDLYAEVCERTAMTWLYLWCDWMRVWGLMPR